MSQEIKNIMVIDKKYEDMLIKDGKVDFSILKPMPEELNIKDSSSNDLCIYTYLSNKFEKSVESVCDTDIAKNAMREWKYDNQFETVEAYIKTLPEQCKKRFNQPILENDNMDSFYEIGKQLVQNYEKYGATTWYDWHMQNWGTKWNADTVSITEKEDGNLDVCFITANTPPAVWFESLAEKGVDFSAGSHTSLDESWYFTAKDGKCEVEVVEPDYDNER